MPSAALRDHLQKLGREVESLSLAQALLHGQLTWHRKKPVQAP